MSTNPSEIQHCIKEQTPFTTVSLESTGGTNNLHFPKPQGYFKPKPMFSDNFIKKLAPEERQLLSVIYGKRLMTFYLLILHSAVVCNYTRG